MATTLAAINTGPVDLITLDLNLGIDDGVDVARQIRKLSDVPIIMLTARDDVIDRVIGLEIGADDYIVKPFHLREVVARIRSVLRRAQNIPEKTPLSSRQDGKAYSFDDMIAIPDRLAVIDRDGKPIDLTVREFKLLELFLTRPKRILSREQLMDLMDGPDYAPLDRTIDNQVARLRKKVERNTAHPALISTVRGMGYSFTCDVRMIDHPVD